MGVKGMCERIPNGRWRVTDSNATVTINNEPAIVGNNGEFTKKLTLFPGKTAVTIRAKNRMGKETIQRKEIEVKP